VRRVSTIATVFALALASGAGAAGPTLSSLESQRRAAVLDLYALDSRVGAAQHRLSALQQQTAALRAQQALLQQQTAATRTTLALSQDQLAENLRNLYKRGSVSALAVMLGARSLDDAVSQLDTLNAVADQSERVVSVATHAQTRLTRLRATLVSERTRLDAAVGAASATLTTLTTARAGRVAFIARLRTAERLKAAQIRALETQVARAQVKSAELTAAAVPEAASQQPVSAASPAPTAAAAPAPAPAPAAAPSGRTLTVTTTGYSLPGHTATGLPVGWGVVAVDPSVIPLGTKLTIPGYGEGVAADTGSAVRGNELDLWFPTLAQARAWGRRTVTISLH
jgi:3D (Asp-Asp-Asp) domain-containing protein